MAEIKICPVCGAPVTVHERMSGSKMTYRLEAQSPRWISVEERMPEAHKNVLIHVTTPIGRWNTEIDCMDEQGWVLNADSEQYHITHWMPLPEPPKEE